MLAAYTALIAYLALRPSVATGGLPGLDKVLHAGAFAVMALLAVWALGAARIAAACAGAFMVGLLIEAGQHALPYGRDASLGDIAANGLGCAAAAFAAKVWAPR